LKLRRANKDDIRNIYELSNSEEVRKVSFVQDKFTFEQHKKWFNEKMKSANDIIIIAEENNSFIGQIRFTIDNHSADISMSIKKEYQGRGVGREMFRKSLEIISIDYNLSKIYAYVKLDNLISNNFFKKIGFEEIDKVQINNCDAIKYCYDL
jgi:RimJ/RimL family protein N-acetyltransferase